MSKAREKISIIIPAYNEGAHIHDNLREFESTLSKLGCDYELIVVDDGSTDNTYEAASKLANGHVKVLTYPENQGKGYALKYGMTHVTGDRVTFIDSDLDLHPDQIAVFNDYMSENGTDIVIGSKRHPRSKVDYPLERRFLSLCYQIFVRFLFGLNLTDTQAGLKLFKRDALQKVLPRVLVKRYAFDLELLVVADSLGYKIVEAPIVLNYKFNGSGVGWKAIRNIFIDTCAVFYRSRILKYYDKIKG